MSLAQQINDRLRAGALVVVVEEADELLAREAALAAAQQFQPVKAISAADQEAQQLVGDLKGGEGTLVVFDFLRMYGDNPLAVRLIREVALQQREGTYAHLILVEAPGIKLPPSLAGDVEIIRPPLPSVAELVDELDAFTKPRKLDLKEEQRYSLAQAVAGLSRHEAARLFGRCWIDSGKKLDAAWLGKAKAIRVGERLGGALSFIGTDGTPDIGGYDALKSWLGERRSAFASEKARKFGLTEPKGLLLVGVPGGGKSLTPKVIAREWGMPLVRLDAGKLFGGLVGQSEANTRLAIEAAEACAPCILHVDEIEKALAGAKSGGNSDGGTGLRVFGQLLTWLQEKTKPVFVVATANRIADLPPELLRKGRFDETFFVDLPTATERKAILDIHIAKRGRDPKTLNTKALAQLTDGFTGAELEQAVMDGLYRAFSKNRDLEVEDLESVMMATNPLSKMMAEDIKALRAWASTRARPASSPEVAKTGAIRRPQVVG